MCRRFLPILRERGQPIKKTGRRLARPARYGEEVLTIINGEVVSKTVVRDDNSMVVRQESADNELYVLDATKFLKNYDMPGVDLVDTDPSSRELRERSFRSYSRKGELRIYQVTEEDLKNVPGGQFEVSFSSIPQSLRPGDYLVTVCPEMDEIYMSRHANIYNDDGQLSHGCGVRTQEEMCSHFLPILKEKGHTIAKSGRRLARLAKRGEEVETIVNGEVMAKHVVSDDTSMVIRQESVDHELYVLAAEKFGSNYVQREGEDKSAQQDTQLLEWQKRGFKAYERKGFLRIYQATEEDMKFVSSGMFQVSFSTIPQPLRVGDYLVTVYPDAREIYMTRTSAMIYNDDGQFSQPGVFCTKEELRAHFLPIMRERGVKLRRAGSRNARPASKGEEVRTIINSNVVFRTVAVDSTSMVVREESADHELYLFTKERFEQNFQLPGEEPESEALRSRGFKSYEMTKGMTMLYKVEESDLKFVKDRLFQMPFSAIPQAIEVGSYLETRYPEEDLVYLSPNAEQIYFSSENLEVHFVFSTPLDEEPLSLDKELEGLRTSGAVVSLTCATRENLVLLKKAWSRPGATVLHVSCHTALDDGNGQMQVILEEPSGRRLGTNISSFLDLIIGGGPAPAVVVLSSCHSEPVAEACLQRGVQRVVAVKGTEELLDKAAKDFAFTFYGELRAHRSVETAFSVAIESMKSSSESGVPNEASKLMLMPTGAPEFKMPSSDKDQLSSSVLGLEPHLAVPIPFGAGEAGSIGPLVQPRSAVPSRMREVGRSHRDFVVRTLEAFQKFRVLKVYGAEGMGKAHFAGLLGGFAAFPGGRFFSSGVIILDRSANAGIPSQERMSEHFIPILKNKGKEVQKGGWRMARPARKGEEVLTVINGEKVASVAVLDDTSMVVRQETSDHELYVLDAEKFGKNYLMPGKEINEQGAEFDTMRERGFKWYDRKGEVLIYRVTDEDMKFMPSGKFEVAFSTIPQPIKVGDYIVTPLPDCSEVYMTRNAEQIYATQIVRSQEEMKKHFSLAVTRLGTLVKRVGEWLARPAVRGEVVETIVHQEVICQTTVEDEDSLVVQAGSEGDSEWYVVKWSEFQKNYEFPGREIPEADESLSTHRERGFKLYRRRGMAKIFKVTAADLEFLPSHRFWGKNCPEPQRLVEGDHLVMGHPDGDEIYMSRNALRVFQTVPAAEIVRSQAEMRVHFVPIMKAKGGVHRKFGHRAARPARKGEKIRTLVDGEMIAKAVVQDDDSMVVMRETVDREMILLSAEVFQRNYDATGREIVEEGLEYDLLRQRGFRYHRRRGKAYVYCVTEEDLEFVPARQFYVPFSSIPQPLRAGDFLVADHPDCRVVYLHRNAMQCFLGIQPELSLSATLGLGNTLGGTLRLDMDPPSPSSPLSSTCRLSFSASDWNGQEKAPDVTGLSDAPWSAPSSFVTRIRSTVAAASNVEECPSPSIVSPLRSTCTSPTRDQTDSPEPSSQQHSRGLRVRAELEEAICDAALQQAEAVNIWYGPQRMSTLKRAGPSVECEAEMAVDNWMQAAPAGSRGLVVLVDGLKYLTYEAPRKLLKNLLVNNPGLYILVTITAPPRSSTGLGPAQSVHPEKFDAVESKAVAAAMKNCPLPLDPQVPEFPKMVPLPPLTDMEIAEVFLMAMMRGQLSRPLGQTLSKMPRKEAIDRIRCHPLVLACKGLPGKAIWEAANVDPGVQTLEELRPSLP